MAKQGPFLTEWLRLQQRMVARTSEYVENVGQLVGQGSMEPREYVEGWTKFWGDLVGEVGDWLRDPKTERPPKTVKSSKGKKVPGKIIELTLEQRVHARPLTLQIPETLFDGDEDPVFVLSVDELTRREGTGAPALTMKANENYRVRPELVTRSTRRQVELKIFDLPDNLMTGDVFEGTLLARLVTEKEQGSEMVRTLGRAKPVAVVEMTVE